MHPINIKAATSAVIAMLAILLRRIYPLFGLDAETFAIFILAVESLFNFTT